MDIVRDILKEQMWTTWTALWVLDLKSIIPTLRRAVHADIHLILNK